MKTMARGTFSGSGRNHVLRNENITLYSCQNVTSSAGELLHMTVLGNEVTAAAGI